MLITKTVKVKWHVKNREWFENKGYIFTKYRGEFEVKVEDLQDTNKASVQIKCDCEDCENPIVKTIQWSSYRKSVHEDGKYYCLKCTQRLFTSKKLKETLLKKHGKSFYDWCIENNRQDLLDRWDYELNKCNPMDICYSTNKRYYFKCPRGLHESELKNINRFMNNFDKYNHLIMLDCKACNSIGQYILDTYGQDGLEKYWDYKKNDELNIDSFKITRGNNSKKVWIKCQEKDYHGSYLVTCNDFSDKQSRCPYCHSRKVHKFDSLGYLYPQVLNVWSDKNKKSPFEYTPYANKEVLWKCLDGKHKDYKRFISSATRCDFRCPKCVNERDESLIQEKTRLYLENLNIGEILHEFDCTLTPKNIIEPPSKRRLANLRYDNEIIIDNNHLFIEVMGGQHEKLCSWYERSAKLHKTTPEKELKYQIAKDKYKEQYVYQQGKNYCYLALWYYHFDKNNTYKKLIDKKLNEILNIKEVI